MYLVPVYVHLAPLLGMFLYPRVILWHSHLHSHVRSSSCSDEGRLLAFTPLALMLNPVATKVTGQTRSAFQSFLILW